VSRFSYRNHAVRNITALCGAITLASATALFVAAPSAQAYPSGPCAHPGTVGPEQDATYTICTNNGWTHVDRSVCEDFPNLFTCVVTPRA
jgi:hypothetical protein